MNLEYVCLSQQSGYAQAARDYIYALEGNKDFNLRVFALDNGPQKNLLSSTADKFTNLRNNAKFEDGVQIFHCIPDIQRRLNKFRLNKTVGFGIFETYSPPPHWIDILNLNNAVICPSQFCVKVFREAGVTRPLHYVPHCIDESRYNNKVEKLYNYPEYTFLFLGAWKERKGYKELLTAWFNSFHSSDNIALVIKTDEPKLAECDVEIFKIKSGNMNPAKLIVDGMIYNEDEIPKFIKSADCLICPTKGEGFGLPGLQAMALGVPLICTDFSGIREYANEANSILLTPEELRLYSCMDRYPQFRNKVWAYVSPEQIADKINHVLNNKDEVKEVAELSSESIIRKFNYGSVLDYFQFLTDL